MMFEKNIKTSYVIVSLLSFSTGIVNGNFLFFVTRYISKGELIKIDIFMTFLFLLSLFLGGIFADIFNRKSIIIIGVLATSLFNFFNLIANNKTYIIIGQIFIVLGTAFSKGILQIIIFESSSTDTEKSKFPKVVKNLVQIQLAVGITALIIGGMLYKVHFRVPWFIATVLSFFALGLVFNLQEKPALLQNREKTKSQIHITNLLWQFVEKNLLVLVLISIFLSLTDQNTPISNAFAFKYSLDGDTLSYVFAASSLVGLILMQILSRVYKNFYSFTSLIIIFFINCTLLLMLSFVDKRLAGMVLMTGYLAFILLTAPIKTVLINNNTEREFRATVSSVIEISSKLVFIGLFTFFTDLYLNDSINVFIIKFVGGAFCLFMLIISLKHILNKFSYSPQYGSKPEYSPK